MGGVLRTAKRPAGAVECSQEERLHKKQQRQVQEAGSSNDEEHIGTATPPCQPLGNLLVRENARNARNPGLGRLAALPDEILIGIFSELEARDLVQLQAVSHAFYAFTRIEGQWKHEYIKDSHGKLGRWRGSWRATYLSQFYNKHGRFDSGLPTDGLDIADVYSDALYTPYMAARYDATRIVSSSKFADNIPRVDGSRLSVDDLGDTPLIMKNVMESWAALKGDRAWSLSRLSRRFPNVLFRAEAVLTKLSDYATYHDHCPQDESPLYIFDADFVEKTEEAEPGGGLQNDFQVPHLFQDDLFSLLGDKRPNFRWLIAGPARSGSTFHCDPNATSAWNAVVTGRKLWILFPPHITPPGILVSDDHAEVEAPLSLAEWLANYYNVAKRQYGTSSGANRDNTMWEGVCNTGEVFYVPSGWWHLVINLEDSIAVTQNFASRTNLDKVLYFLRHRAQQVSGFGIRMPSDENSLDVEDESGGGRASQLFETALADVQPHLYRAAVHKLESQSHNTGSSETVKKADQSQSHNLWHKLNQSEQQNHDPTPSFAFSFDVDLASVDS